MMWAEATFFAVVVLIAVLIVLLFEMRRRDQAAAKTIELLDIMEDKKQELDARLSELSPGGWDE